MAARYSREWFSTHPNTHLLGHSVVQDLDGQEDKGDDHAEEKQQDSHGHVLQGDGVDGEGAQVATAWGGLALKNELKLN